MAHLFGIFLRNLYIYIYSTVHLVTSRVKQNKMEMFVMYNSSGMFTLFCVIIQKKNWSFNKVSVVAAYSIIFQLNIYLYTCRPVRSSGRKFLLITVNKKKGNLHLHLKDYCWLCILRHVHLAFFLSSYDESQKN